MRFYPYRDGNVRTLQTICRITLNCPPHVARIIGRFLCPVRRGAAFQAGIYENVYEVVGFRRLGERERKKHKIFTTRMRCYVLILPNGRIPRLSEVALFRARIVSLLFDCLCALFLYYDFFPRYIYFFIRTINYVPKYLFWDIPLYLFLRFTYYNLSS